MAETRKRQRAFREMTQRTPQQNKSLHKYFTMLANELNDSGQDMRKTLKPDIEIPWGTESIKEMMFKPIIKAMFNVDSTTDLDTKQISEAYEVLNRHTASKLGVSVDWPHEEDKP